MMSNHPSGSRTCLLERLVPERKSGQVDMSARRAAVTAPTAPMVRPRFSQLSIPEGSLSTSARRRGSVPRIWGALSCTEGQREDDEALPAFPLIE